MNASNCNKNWHCLAIIFDNFLSHFFRSFVVIIAPGWSNTIGKNEWCEALYFGFSWKKRRLLLTCHIIQWNRFHLQFIRFIWYFPSFSHELFHWMSPYGLRSRAIAAAIKANTSKPVVFDGDAIWVFIRPN